MPSRGRSPKDPGSLRDASIPAWERIREIRVRRLLLPLPLPFIRARCEPMATGTDRLLVTVAGARRQTKRLTKFIAVVATSFQPLSIVSA